MMNSLNVAHEAHKRHVISAHTIHVVVGWLVGCCSVAFPLHTVRTRDIVLAASATLNDSCCSQLNDTELLYFIMRMANVCAPYSWLERMVFPFGASFVAIYCIQDGVLLFCHDAFVMRIMVLAKYVV